MGQDKVLTNFPEAFYPIVVVVGDRREDPPKSMADLLAYSVSSVDVLFLQRLNLGRVDILSDKVFVLEDLQTLRRKYNCTNLLVIGSPAVNLLARKINDSALFCFNISEEAKRKLARQEEILDEIKFDQESLQIYREILLGANSADKVLFKFKDRPGLDKELGDQCKGLLRRYKNTGLKRWKDLIHEFDRPGIKDPIDKTIHGRSPKPHLDYGLISIARNPFSSDDKHLTVYVAGVHGPGTAHCVKLLADKSAFQTHPYGGVVEIKIDIFKGWTERVYDAKINWQTASYKEKDDRVPDSFIKIIHTMVIGPESPKRKKAIFISSPYNKDDKVQKKFNSTIGQIFKKFHEERNIEAIFHDPYSYKPTGQFPEEILKKFKRADYIIHDITRFSKGVLFEVGYSFGLRKNFFLVWDKSRADFDARDLPELLQAIDVTIADFGRKKDFKKVLEDQILSPGIDLRKKSLCPRSDGVRELTECTEDMKKEKKRGKELAYVLVPKQFVNIRKQIAETLKRHGIFVLRDYEIATNIISKTCCGIKRAKYCFVDISDDDFDGIITLGFSKAMGKGENTLMLYRERVDKNVLSMWKGKECEWSEDSWKDEVDKKVSELVLGVRIKDRKKIV